MSIFLRSLLQYRFTFPTGPIPYIVLPSKTHLLSAHFTIFTPSVVFRKSQVPRPSFISSLSDISGQPAILLLLMVPKQ